jgi:IMP dehydrogenase
MARVEISQHLSFDDVLLVPQYSDVVPTEVDTSTTLAGLTLKIPVFSAAMDTVTEGAMAAAMWAAGGIGVIHKNLSPSRQFEELRKAHDSMGPILSMAVGAKDWEQRLTESETLLDLAVIDSAHGHSKNVLSAVSGMKKKFPSMKIMAGNVVTPEAVRALADAGADIVKVGIGGGSICTTRLVSGCGMPQLIAVMSCAEEADKIGVPTVADGGIKCSGDIVKALAAGADAVMIGSLLAGASETPGDLIDGRWKSYRGMGSVRAMDQGSKDRYGQSGVARDKLVPEGVEAMVPHRGPVSDVLHQLIGGLKAGMGYVGAKNLRELQAKAKFIRITSSGVRENGVHDVKM